MLKKMLQQKGISIYQLAKQSDLPYSTLNDIVNHKIAIENCKAQILYKLSKALDLSMEHLYDLCSGNMTIFVEPYNIQGFITVKNKLYSLEFEYKGQFVHMDLHKVNAITTFYIKEIAQWKIEKFVSEKEMEEKWNAICADAKR